MTFKQTVHRHLQALERSKLYARLFATPLEIHEAGDAGVALLHLLYSHLTLVYQRRDDEWVVVQNQHSPI